MDADQRSSPTPIASPAPPGASRYAGDITIALTRHAESDALLLGALESLAAQCQVQGIVLVLDQCPSSRVEKYCSSISTGDIRFHYSTLPSCGISRARNRALTLCETDLLLFTEPDARPDPRWAYWLSDALAQGAAVAGGRIVPDWQSRPPLVARSGLIMDLYSLLDLGPHRCRSSKVIGCNFGINRTVLGCRHARFDERYGRTPGTLMGGEEMELCERAAGAGMGIIYEGRALVMHRIEKERTRYRWLARRLYAAGKSRAIRGGMPEPSNSPGISVATAFALPLYLAYFAGYISYKLRARRAVAGRPD